MKKRWIYLPEWDWLVILFYWVSPTDALEILSEMERIGAGESVLVKAANNLCSDQLNNGLTYTNDFSRTSIMVVGRTSSPEEAWNTIAHEQGHVAQHIAEALGLDNSGEEKQYLTGSLAQEIYPFVTECQTKTSRT